MRLRCLLAATIVCLPLGAAAVGFAAPQPPLQRVLVGFQGDHLPTDLHARLSSLGVTSAVAFETINTIAITAPSAAVAALVDDADVRGWRAERRLQFDLANSVPFIGAAQATVGVAQDYTVETPDGPTVMGTRPAVDGTGVTVAVIDTGVTDLHPDLARRVVGHRNFELAHAADFILSSEELDLFAEATSTWARIDDFGHGTHVAGTIAGDGQMASGRENDNRGVAPGASIIDLRISDCVPGCVGLGSGEDIGWERNAVAAFDWLLRHHTETQWGPNGIQVTSNSWGIINDTIYGDPAFDPLNQVVNRVLGQGIHTVFSAGNSGIGDDVHANTPVKGLPGVITVAAACHPGSSTSGCDGENSWETVGSFSSRGAAVDIAAPGVDIVAAGNVSAVSALGHTCPPDLPGACLYGADYSGSGGQADSLQNFAWYASISGTSMAAPHIGGVVALLVQVHPTITPEEVRVLLAHTAIDYLDKGRDIHTGWGMVNVPDALIAAARLAAGERLVDITADADYPVALDDASAEKQRNAD